MNFLIEGLDRLGKDSLIEEIQNANGFYQVIHRSKPKVLNYYAATAKDRGQALYAYQRDCFSSDMLLLESAFNGDWRVIFNRAWLGEAVYSNLYRGYDGNYVFDLEKRFQVDRIPNLRLILLTEDFKNSKHFEDDGLSIDVSKREKEQEMFVAAFEKSIILDKRIVCVTDPVTGDFKSKLSILKSATE